MHKMKKFQKSVNFFILSFIIKLILKQNLMSEVEKINKHSVLITESSKWGSKNHLSNKKR